MRGFFSQGDVFAVSVGEKRIIWITMVARAEPGHASQPWDEAATHRLVRAANAILAQPPEEPRVPAPVAEMIGRLGGDRAREEIALVPRHPAAAARHDQPDDVLAAATRSTSSRSRPR